MNYLHLSFSILFCLSASVLSAGPKDIIPSVPQLASAGYKLVFSDEFNGNTLGLGKWDYRTDSKKASTQLPANVTIANGILNLNLKKESAGGKDYTGAGIISKQAYRFGYYETRMKTPPGSGWHTSFWMQKHDGSGGTDPRAAAVELDAIENDSQSPMAYGVTFHQWNPKPAKEFGGKWMKTPSLSEGFHTIGCEYTEKSVTYFFDGKPVQTIDATKIVHGDVNIWLTSIGYPAKNQSIDDTKLPAAAQYDYVRFFRK